MSMYETDDPRVAFFRPNDERAERAVETLRDLGATPVSDPMLAVEQTGELPREDGDFAILTSKTGVEIAADAGWNPSGEIVAIGSATAGALETAGYEVDRIPAEYTSSGLVSDLRGTVDGSRVEVARSDHGSAVLMDGLEAAGSYVHETILYRLVRPDSAGKSARMAAAGELAGVCFTSSLTVEHFLEAAAEQGIRRAAIDGLTDAVVGAIGDPTQNTAEESGIDVDVVAETATFDALARAVVDECLNSRAQ